jgi:hypothetical protein
MRYGRGFEVGYRDVKGDSCIGVRILIWQTDFGRII